MNEKNEWTIIHLHNNWWLCILWKFSRLKWSNTVFKMRKEIPTYTFLYNHLRFGSVRKKWVFVHTLFPDAANPNPLPHSYYVKWLLWSDSVCLERKMLSLVFPRRQPGKEENYKLGINKDFGQNYVTFRAYILV